MDKIEIRKRYEHLRHLLDDARSFPDVSVTPGIHIIPSGSYKTREARVQSPEGQRILAALADLLELSPATRGAKIRIQQDAAMALRFSMPTYMILSQLEVQPERDVWGIFDPEKVCNLEMGILGPLIRKIGESMVATTQPLGLSTKHPQDAIKILVQTYPEPTDFHRAIQTAGIEPLVALALTEAVLTLDWIREFVDRYQNQIQTATRQGLIEIASDFDRMAPYALPDP